MNPEKREKYIIQLQDDSLDKQTKFFCFHFLLLGYEFRRRSDGCIRGKVGLWCKYSEPLNTEVLVQLVTDTHPEYERVNKPNYEDGEYKGLLAGENPARVYRLCPEKKVHKIRNAEVYSEERAKNFKPKGKHPCKKEEVKEFAEGKFYMHKDNKCIYNCLKGNHSKYWCVGTIEFDNDPTHWFEIGGNNFYEIKKQIDKQ